ncbi:MAG TPA: aminotransferase class I/II-fold pyridoxal phosphate-dependent enzyme [Acidimicrobiales bacterium]
MGTAMIPARRERGGDGVRLAAALGVSPSEILDLSASLNPVAPDLRPVLIRHLDAVGRYPDPDAATDALAAAMAVPRSQLLLTNGGAEAIALVAQSLGRGRVDEPEFSLYRRHLADVGPDGPRWRSNPHSPTGRLARADETAAVWDEAFWPLAAGTWTRGDAQRGAVVLGSLTKLLACPGLRAGFVHSADEDLLDRLRRHQPRWAVNGLVCDSLADMLAEVDLPRWVAEIRRLRGDLDQLLRHAGLAPEPSDANWVLVPAPGLRDRLAHERVLIRDCASFGMPGTVRIAVPSDEGRMRLARALDLTQL